MRGRERVKTVARKRGSTLVVPLAHTLMVDEFKNLILTHGEHRNGHG